MISRVCEQLKMSRQNFYREKRRRQRKQLEEDRVLECVQEQRQRHPRIGVRKLLVLIGPQLKSEGIQVGRDRLFELLGKKGLLIKRKRRKIKTTDSRHQQPVYPNQLKDCELTGAHQAWVSDLTYLQTVEGTLFLSLISDAYSRKIIGWHLSPHLSTEGCLEALKKALQQLPPGATPLHHSDRGCQYASRDYTKLLEKHHCGISMTEENHCYENAQAERLNGILKHEYGLKEKWNTKDQLRRAVTQAIRLYNEQRPHQSLGYQTPQQVHQESGVLPPNPQDLSLQTEPMRPAHPDCPEGPKNRNDDRLRPLDARVASQQSPTLPVAENILTEVGNF